MMAATDSSGEKYLSRYPGLPPFTEVQEKLFFGRKLETAQLLNMLLSEQLVVLFAKSGVGKSSLLQAGLFPQLKRNGYYPIKIRFQNPTSEETIPGTPIKLDSIQATPKDIVLHSIREAIADSHSNRDSQFRVSFNSNAMLTGEKDNVKLWEWIKILSIQKQKDKYLDLHTDASIIPVLVFDQFEEFFRYTETRRNEFCEELAEIFHDFCPKRIAQWMRNNNPEERTLEMANWAKQPQVKCIIAIRDDKLSELDQLRRYIPLILKNRYRLHPLRFKNAEQAIELPAKMGGKFAAPPFSFDKVILTEILLELSNSKSDAKAGSPEVHAGESGSVPKAAPEADIDGSQLQKVCMHIEKKVIAGWPTPSGTLFNVKSDIVVDQRIINPKSDIPIILDNFYGEQLKTLGSAKDIQFCRNIIEGHLVSGGMRASLTERQMDDLFEGKSRQKKAALLERLQEARLIKKEYTHLGLTYELSHDTLVKPVSRYAEQNEFRAINKVKFIYGVLLACACFLLLGCCYFFYRMILMSDKMNVTLAENYYQQGNHYMAFSIWDNFQDCKFPPSDEKLQVREMLNTLTFFDIGMGVDRIFLNDSMVAVLEMDNCVNLWTICYNGNRDIPSIKREPFNGAFNLRATESRSFFGFRKSNGELKVYDVIKNEIFKIPESQSSPILSKYKRDDAKMGFIRGGDFLGYVDGKGDVKLYDLRQRKNVSLRILKVQDKEFNSEFIDKSLRISSDQEMIAIHKADTLRVYDIASINSAVKVRKEPGVLGLINTFESEFVCYYKKDSIFLEDYKGTVLEGTGIRSFMKGLPQVSPDGKKLFFYNKNSELIVLDGATKRVDTVIHDVQYYTKAEINNVNHYAAKWQQGRIYYFNKKEHRQIYPDTDNSVRNFILSPKNPHDADGVSWSIKGNTIVAVNPENKRYYDEVLVQEPPGPGIPDEAKAFLSTDTNFVAYIIEDKYGNRQLTVVDRHTLTKVLTLSGITEIVLPFTGKYIVVKNETNKYGLYFLSVPERNYIYYRSLYPALGKKEQELLNSTLF